MTYRQRRLAKAARLRGWAETRVERANATLASFDHYRGDWAFATQPGRIPERDRMNRAEARSFESLDKADRMAARAASIEAAADHAIYSDDPDAIERLRERIAERERKRDDRKSANAAYRKEHAAELRTMTAYERSVAVPWPPYSITNLTQDIARLRARLTGLERAQEVRNAS